MPTKAALTAIILFFQFVTFNADGQDKTLNCSGLHEGVFHSYPKNSADHYVTRVEANFQHETNTKNGDTTLWQVKWTGDCTYTLKYIAGGKKLPPETLDLLQKHKLAYQIVSITDNYYIYKAYFDKTSNLPIATDTAWFSEKTNYTSNEFYKRMPNNGFLRKEHFKDTSNYAVLYLYRPGKTTNCLANYMVYYNDNVMCVVKNKSGYIFKILKEGDFKLSSRLFKDESSVQLTVKFGNVYYIKSMIHWGISRRLYNFKLEMASVIPELGKNEFEEVNLQ